MAGVFAHDLMSGSDNFDKLRVALFARYLFEFTIDDLMLEQPGSMRSNDELVLNEMVKQIKLRLADSSHIMPRSITFDFIKDMLKARRSL